MTRDIRVVVADDQPLLRHSLALIVNAEPGITVVGEASSGTDAVRCAREQRPDIVVMDIRMPDMDGIEATERIVQDPLLTECRIVVLSMFELDEYVHRSLRAGASGFLLKDTEPEHLVDAICRVHAGESLFSPQILQRFVDTYMERGIPLQRAAPASPLTERETEVLTLIARGLSNQEIMHTLRISMGTVKSHVGNLLSKLHARDRSQLVIAAYESGLITPGSPE